MSWRKFRQLVEEWDENPPTYFILRGIVEGLVGKPLGKKKKGRKISAENLLKRLQLGGEVIQRRRKKR